SSYTLSLHDALPISRFGEGEELDLDAIIFLVGVQELGMGFRKFKKDEKVNLMHIAICRVLEPYGYYEYEGRDADGWPHYKVLERSEEHTSELQSREK